MEINREHLQLRATQRMIHNDVFMKVARNLTKQIKLRNVPNQDWYKPVMMGNKCIGYFCGFGVSIRTILSADMTPRGVEI